MARAFKSEKNKLPGMTMLEVLIVMGIISILFSLGVYGFVVMRQLQRIEQTSQTYYSNIRNIQREALLYNRSLNENWIWGVVVKVGGLTSATEQTLQVYKYCAPEIFTEYEKYPVGTVLPIDAVSSPEDEKCFSQSASLVVTDNIDLGENLTDYSSVADTGGSDTPIYYIVFETLTGKIHYYDNSGQYILGNSNLEITMGNGAPTARLIKYDMSKGRFSLDRIPNP